MLPWLLGPRVPVQVPPSSSLSSSFSLFVFWTHANGETVSEETALPSGGGCATTTVNVSLGAVCARAMTASPEWTAGEKNARVERPPRLRLAAARGLGSAWTMARAVVTTAARALTALVSCAWMAAAGTANATSRLDSAPAQTMRVVGTARPMCAPMTARLTARATSSQASVTAIRHLWAWTATPQ